MCIIVYDLDKGKNCVSLHFFVMYSALSIQAGEPTVVFTQQKESSGKCLLCISIKQRIDNMYTQVAIHASTIGSLVASQFFPSSC